MVHQHCHGVARSVSDDGGDCRYPKCMAKLPIKAAGERHSERKQLPCNYVLFEEWIICLQFTYSILRDNHSFISANINLKYELFYKWNKHLSWQNWFLFFVCQNVIIELLQPQKNRFAIVHRNGIYVWNIWTKTMIDCSFANWRIAELASKYIPKIWSPGGAAKVGPEWTPSWGWEWQPKAVCG